MQSEKTQHVTDSSDFYGKRVGKEVKAKIHPTPFLPNLSSRNQVLLFVVSPELKTNRTLLYLFIISKDI